MRNILFLSSHLFSGSNELATVLNENSRIDLIEHLLTYDHPIVLDYLYNRGHKLDNTAAIYGGQILFNKDFGCKAFYDFSKFIYVIRSAKPTLNAIKRYRKEYSELTACRYYCFRLRRIYEMARSSPGSVFLTEENFATRQGMDLIGNHLNLKEPLRIPNVPEVVEDDFSSQLIAKAQDCYEKYLYHLKQLDLVKI